MISICMATYNGEKYITEQVNSILPQLSENDELIVSDDGSTDGTLKILESFNDKRIKIFHHKRFGNRNKNTNNNYYSLTQNFSNAMQHAKGDCIFLSDQDDVWLPNKINAMLSLLQKWDLVICDAWVVDEQLNKLFLISKNKTPRRGFFKSIFSGTAYGCCCALTKKLKDIAVPIPENVIGHDYFIKLLAEKLNSVHFMSEPLMLYRRHSETATSLDKSANSCINKFIYRLHLFLESNKRFKNPMQKQV